MADWLKELKEGDKVFINSQWYGLTLDKVERITKTQIQVGKSKYRKVGGCIVGDTGYNSRRLFEYNEANKEAYLKQNLHKECRQLIMDLDYLSKVVYSEEIKFHLSEVVRLMKRGEA